MRFGNLLFSFEGRIGRGQFWLGWIAVGAAEWAIDTVVKLASGYPGDGTAQAMPRDVVSLVVGLLVMYPAAAVAVKRLRDRDDPVSWIWLLLAADAVGEFAEQFGVLDGDRPLTLFTFIVAAFVSVVLLAFLIELGLRRGRRAEAAA